MPEGTSEMIDNILTEYLSASFYISVDYNIC